MPTELAVTPATAVVLASAYATSPQVAIPVWLELVAIVASSISGALTARENHLDLVGAVCLAVLCSLGGGLLRDAILQVGNVYILTQPAALPAAIITAAVVFVFPTAIAKQDRLIAVLDIFAVGLYAATGADKALVYGFNPLICVIMGFFTGVGGGMLRDVFLGQVPHIFQQSNLYAVAAIAGGAVYVALADAGVSRVVAVVVCVAVTMGLRWLSLRYNIMSPTADDLTRMVQHRRGRRRSRGAAETDGRVAPANKPRLDRSDRSASELAERRRRTVADIDRRRSQERRTAGPGQLRRDHRKRENRKVDV